MRGVVPIAGGVLLYFAMPVCADEAPSFAKDVAPIFAANCAGCHASNVAMGTLDLDTFAGIQKGGHSGPVIAPGKSGESLLYLRITGAVTPAMPLNGKKLADGEIEIIRKWIDGGAKPPAPGEVVAKGAAAIPDIKPRTAVKPLISALAILARTYALNGSHYTAAPGRLAAELCDSTECQAMRLEAPPPAIDDATRATAGETLWFSAGRAEVFFSQNCGGITEDAGVVWPKLRGLPYLRSHADPYCLRRDSPA